VPFRGPVHTVFLDRDGVINEKMPEGRYVTRWDEFHLLPDVVQAIAMLNRAGVRVVVVSNQREWRWGFILLRTYARCMRSCSKSLPRSARVWTGSTFARTTKACASAANRSRHVRAGVAEFPSITAATSVMIGDSKSDMEFGRRLGMRAVFIEGDAERRGRVRMRRARLQVGDADRCLKRWRG